MDLNEFAERVVTALERIARSFEVQGEPCGCITAKAKPEEPCCDPVERPSSAPAEPSSAPAYEDLEREDLFKIFEERGLGAPAKRTYTTSLVKMLKAHDAAVDAGHKAMQNLTDAAAEHLAHTIDAEIMAEVVEKEELFPDEKQITKADVLKILQNLPNDPKYIKAKKLVGSFGYRGWAEVPEDIKVLEKIVTQSKAVR